MYHIIINPASRSGRGKKIWLEVVQPAMLEKNISFQAYFSEKAGDVERLASYISSTFPGSPEDPCRLIVLGGDGTVNETLQGVHDFTNVILGYIPTGSSNDLARDLGISKDPLDALEHILDAETHPEYICRMDRGLTITDGHNRSFAVSCGLGFDAAVCEEAMNSRIKDTLNRLGLGKLTYFGIALKQLFAAPRTTCKLYLDDKKEPVTINKFLFMTAMNHQYEGGGFKFCPGADYTDGVLELCVAGNLPKLVVLFALPTAFFGKHYLVPGIHHYSARKVRLECSAPLWLHTDGEVHRRASVLEVSCDKQAIRFIH